MDPPEGALFRVNADWSTSELTHFNLVVRYVKWNSRPSCFSAFSAVSRCSCGPFDPWCFHLCDSEAVLNYQKLHFVPETPFWSLQLKLLKWNMTWATEGNRHVFFLQVWSFGFRWGWTCCAPNSLELKQLFMPTWLDLTTFPAGSNARLHRKELSPL